MTSTFWITTEDWHTAGEPFRIVDKLPPDHLPISATVAQRRLDIVTTPNHPLNLLRQVLCHEPRGHADMYGGFICPPNDSGGHLGVLFWHKDGFSTACGHGTIALGYWAVEKGLVETPSDGQGTVDVVIDVPSGRVVATVTLVQGKPVHADFINVESYQLAKSLNVTIHSLPGVDLSVDLVFGGAVYASLNASQVGLSVKPHHVNDFIKLGREIKASLGVRAHYKNYDCYGVIFFDESDAGTENDDQGKSIIRQTNVAVFADGQIDRSPCGSGTSARLAALLAEGRLGLNGMDAKLLHESIIGSVFEADVVSMTETSPVDGFPACIPRVRGVANLVGRMNFFIDPEDSVFPGFLLR